MTKLEIPSKIIGDMVSMVMRELMMLLIFVCSFTAIRKLNAATMRSTFKQKKVNKMSPSSPTSQPHDSSLAVETGRSAAKVVLMIIVHQFSACALCAQGEDSSIVENPEETSGGWHTDALRWREDANPSVKRDHFYKMLSVMKYCQTPLSSACTPWGN
jgi:hypothetical protein